MSARDFYARQLMTDANSAIDVTKSKFTYFDMINFAEKYHIYELSKQLIQKKPKKIQ